MLSIGMLSLVCSLASGVYAFGADAPLGWTWGKSLFVMFLFPAVACFAMSTLRRPSLLWAVVDDLQSRRFQKLQPNQPHSRSGDHDEAYDAHPKP